MSNRHGSLSINSDNIFPIIKKWLYSDHDIFYRELISNGCDAITKLKKLDMICLLYTSCPDPLSGHPFCIDLTGGIKSTKLYPRRGLKPQSYPI